MSTTRVSADLATILDMATRLEQRAVDQASTSGMPGGEAMVNLAHVADLTTWERRNELADDGLVAYEDPDEMWPASQQLRFWSEQWREQLGMNHDDPRWRPTLASEAAFLRNPDVLAWAWDNELHFDHFAADVASVKTKLETVLVEGERSERGVPCMYPECRGARIVRKLEPARAEDGSKTWRLGNWHCPRCHRSWTADAYARMVTAAHEETKTEVVAGQVWCTVEYAARRVDRPTATIRVWMHRDELATACMIAGRRLPFVSLDEVAALSDTRPRRDRRSTAS